MENHVGRPGQRVSLIVAQIESADEDGLPDLLGKTREALEEIESLAVRDQRMKEALRLVRAMARALQRKDKRKATRNGRDAMKELKGAGS